MLRNKRLLFAVGLAASLLLAALGAVILMLGMKGTFDSEIRHFESGSIHLTLLVVAVLFSAAVALATGVLLRQSPLALPNDSAPLPVAFAAALTAFLFLASAVFDFADARTVLLTSVSASAPTYVMFLRLRGVFAALAAIYPALTALQLKKVSASALKALSMLPLAWCLVMTLSQYFNSQQAINDPTKSLTLLLGVVYLFLFMAECRIRLARKTPGILAFLLLLAVSVGGTISLGSLALLITGEHVFGLSFMNTALYTAIWLFALSRALFFCKLLGEPTGEKPQNSK